MSASLTFDGLDELRAALRRMPDDLAAQAGPIVADVAQAAHGDIDGAYPEHTGNLKSRLYVTNSAVGRFGAASAVKSAAKHASIFENGTKPRRTASGAYRGVMPAGHVFVPAVVRWRKTMYERLRAMLVAHGLEVSG